jgi:hypothetical protein
VEPILQELEAGGQCVRRDVAADRAPKLPRIDTKLDHHRPASGPSLVKGGDDIGRRPNGVAVDDNPLRAVPASGGSKAR